MVQRRFTAPIVLRVGNTTEVVVDEQSIAQHSKAHPNRFAAVSWTVLPSSVIESRRSPSSDVSPDEMLRILFAEDDPATAHIPVVMLTHRDAAQDALAGLEVGAEDYIPKDSFAEQNLVESLRQLGVL